MIRLLVRLVLVLVLIAALLIGMTCCAARVVFGSCAEIGVQQTVRNLEDFFLWLRDVWALARVKLNLCMVTCLLYTSPSPRDRTRSRMPSSA